MHELAASTIELTIHDLIANVVEALDEERVNSKNLFESDEGKPESLRVKAGAHAKLFMQSGGCGAAHDGQTEIGRRPSIPRR